MQTPACIGLGSNQGDRRKHLLAALETLDERADIRITAISPIIQTHAVGPVPQDPFLNAAAVLSTTLDARHLLGFMLDIEQTRGRDRTRSPHWGPRTLDLDLLLFGDAVIDEPGLQIPHPQMLVRDFVLEPLSTIAPDWPVPTTGMTIRHHLEALMQTTKRADPHDAESE